MRVLILFFASLFLQTTSFGWGITGHHTIGLIAQKHLSKKAKRKLRDLLKHESLAVASTWMDEERSNPKYYHVTDWHWVDMPKGQTYETSEKNPKGDIIATINRLIDELEKGGLSKEEEVIHIKMLVHFVGDIHQPLHCGTGEDAGGNRRSVRWFGDDTNLHTVWDTKIIDSKRFSYTELAAAIDHTDDPALIEKWQNEGILTWVDESVMYRDKAYEGIPEDDYIGNKYIYDQWPVIQLRLHQAGVRLAGILNKLYK